MDALENVAIEMWMKYGDGVVDQIDLIATLKKHGALREGAAMMLEFYQMFVQSKEGIYSYFGDWRLNTRLIKEIVHERT